MQINCQKMAAASKVVYFFLVFLSSTSADQIIDLTGPGCHDLDGYYITDASETITVESIPNYNVVPTGDYCDVNIYAETGRRIQYIVSRLKFDECGIEISIYDADNSEPAQYLKCGSETEVPISGLTRYHTMRITVRQTQSLTRHYEFQMQLRNDLGPPLEYLEDESGYQGESLQTGVIVGLVIAGIIVIVALILLAIYLCVRARQAHLKENAHSTQDDRSIYTSGTSQAIFPPHGQPLSKRKGYGSFEDVRSTSSSQAQANGSYSNPAYTKGSDEKRSERQASFGRARGKAGFANAAYNNEDGSRGYDYWEEGEETRGSLRKSRRDAFDIPPTRELKSAMKKPTEIEMSKVRTQPVGILKASRARSPNRSTAGSSTDGSTVGGSTVDPNALVRGYKDSGIDHPNVKKSLGMQRRPRSRSGGRSNASSGHGSQRGRRSHSADKKPPKDTGRMYTGGAFIDDGSNRRRSGRRARSNSSGGRSRARSDRTSDSLDSESTSTTTSRRVSMNPGGRRVHIKGEETDI